MTLYGNLKNKRRIMTATTDVTHVPPIHLSKKLSPFSLVAV